MLHLLKRHPFPVTAHFRFSFVLTYALPQEELIPLLPPGLTLDTYGDFGFVAIALVQTEKLRPVGFPKWLGQDFFLVGYRIFARYQTKEGRNLRGLRILRSETDKRRMVWLGNLFTHYGYRYVAAQVLHDRESLMVRVRDETGESLHLHASIHEPATKLPPGSPFPDFQTARRYAGPLPFTFDYEHETHSILRVQGRRDDWNPLPARVAVYTNTFFTRPEGPFANCTVHPVLANAFYVADIPYRWEKGIREPL